MKRRAFIAVLGGAAMVWPARFKAKVEMSDGESYEMPAETCRDCKGIGYLTRPLTYESRRRGERKMHVRRAGSGDWCPTCAGRGWVGFLGGGWADFLRSDAT